MEPIILIDDDHEDLELLKEMVEKMGVIHPVLTFSDPGKALDFLTKTLVAPLFILCDVNMPKLNGFELRDKLLITGLTEAPFFFFSTSKTDTEIERANELHVSGYYQKKSTFSEMKEALRSIIMSLNIMLGK